MRALLIAVWLCGVASASPYAHTRSTSTDPAIVAAERKWTVASASRGPAQPDLWADAAVAFAAIAESTARPEAERVHAARSALAALRSSIAGDVRASGPPATRLETDVPTPQPLGPRDQRVLRVLGVAARYATSADERASLAFERANILRRYDQHDQAIPIFLAIIAEHPRHEVAEYSANLVLDAYNRLHRYDEMLAFANRLRGDKGFLANRPELERTVRRLLSQGQTIAAVQFTRRARETGERSFYERCAEAYLAIIEATSPHEGDDAVLYNALVCLHEAGAIDRMLEVSRLMTARLPDSQHTKRAQMRTIGALATVGRIDEAAAAGERWLRGNALERDAAELLEDTLRWRAASGDLDTALRTLDAFVARSKRVPALAEHTALVAIGLAEKFLDDARDRPAPEAARRRAIAVRLVQRRPHVVRSIRADPGTRVDVAAVIAAAACPVPLVDELCPRSRDPALVASARRELARVPRPNDRATLALADLELEAILAGRAATANLDADYRELAASADPDVRVAAFARLAALAKHAGNTAEHARQLQACITEAYVSRAGDRWSTGCVRELSASEPVRGREAMFVPSAPPVFALDVLRYVPPLQLPPTETDARDLFELDCVVRSTGAACP